ncbi:MAG: hypothetical protein ACHQ01_05220 [Candidatus Limnocylindrales bacterium]
MDELHVPASSSDLDRRLGLRRALVDVLGAIAARQVPAAPIAPLIQSVERYGGDEGAATWALILGLRALEKATAWEPSVEGAEPDASRFRDAARHLAGRAMGARRHGVWSAGLVAGLEILARLDAFDDVPRAASSLAHAALSIPVTSVFEVSRQWSPRSESKPTEPAPTVLLRFDLEAQPVSWPMALSPGRAYRLRATAAIDRWPSNSDQLTIELGGDVPQSVIERSSISIRREALVGETYIVPRAEIAPGETAELVPTVSFSGDGGSVTANVVGQRLLRVTTFDPATLGSGQPMVAQRIIELLAELDSKIPTLPSQDRRNLIQLLDATARFAALANERADLRGLNEQGFQAMLKAAYIQDPLIGRRIQEAPKLGGGTTDLILERVVDELKIQHDSIDIDDADKFVRQPTQYSAAADCPISMLTILDDSSKSDPPGVQSNYMRWAYPKIHGARRPRVPSMVVVVIIPIGFRVPSAWSGSRGQVEHGT